MAARVHQDGAGGGHGTDVSNRFGLGDGRSGFAVVVTRGRVGAHRRCRLFSLCEPPDWVQVGQLLPPASTFIVAKLLPAALAEGEAEPRGPQQLPVPMLWLMPVLKPRPRMASASLSDMTAKPERPIWLRVLVEMPLAALAEPATQTSAATNVERITLLICRCLQNNKRGEMCFQR